MLHQFFNPGLTKLSNEHKHWHFRLDAATRVESFIDLAIGLTQTILPKPQANKRSPGLTLGSVCCPIIYWNTCIIFFCIPTLPSPKLSWVTLESQPVLQTQDFCAGAMKQQIVYLTKGRLRPSSDSPFWLHVVFLLDEKRKEMRSRKGFLRFASWHSTVKLMLTKAQFH